MITIKKFLAVFLVLLPILLYYDFPFTSINIGTVGCLLCFFLLLVECITSNKFLLIVKSNIPFTCLIIYVFVVSLVLFFKTQGFNFTSFLLVAVNMVIALFIWSDKEIIDKKTFLKTYRLVAYFSIFVFLLQLLFGFVFKKTLPGKILFLPLTESFAGINSEMKPISDGVLSNCYSLFSEQSHFAVFLLPLFHLSFLEKTKSVSFKVFKILFVGLIIILTNSANGIIGLAIILLMNAFTFYRKHNSHFSFKTITILILFGLIIVFAFQILNQIPYFNSMFSRLFTDSGNRASKAGYRIYRGFYLIGTLPLSQLFTGIGYLQLEKYVTLNNIQTPYDIYDTGPALEYTNFICQMTLYFGLIGIILFVISVLVFISRKRIEQIAFIVCLIALWFSSSMLFEQTFLFFSSFIVCSSAYKDSITLSIPSKNIIDLQKA